MPAGFDPNFSFNEQLWYYYSTNRGKIRSRYNDLTRKFLAYNDGEENPHAFLRKPQFEALEMYVFVKEFMNNKQVYEMFDDWRHRRDRFSDASYYSVDKGGQIRLGVDLTEKQTDTLFKQKQTAAEEMAVASGIKYLMYAGSQIMSSHILDDSESVYPRTISCQQS